MSEELEAVKSADGSFAVAPKIGMSEGYRNGLTTTLGNVEFTAESMNETLGNIAISSTALVAGLGSAVAVGFASYTGLSTYLTVSNWIILSVAILIALIVEIINFSAIVNRDRTDSYNRRQPDESKHLKSSASERLSMTAFMATLATVITFESGPAAFHWAMGEIQSDQALFRIGLAVLPILSRIGAQIFSQASLLRSVDTLGSEKQFRDLTDDLRKQKMLDDYARQQAEENARTSARINKMSEIKPKRTSDNGPKHLSDTGVTTANRTTKGTDEKVSTADSKSDNRRRLILDILTEHISLGATELHRLLGGETVCTRSTLYEDLAALADNGLAYNADRKWHIGKTEVIEVADVEFSTNGVGHEN